MIDEIENNEEYDEESSFDKDELSILKHALIEFNEKTGLGWTLGDLDFIVSFPGPLTRSWYDEFNAYVQNVLKKVEEGTLTL